MAGSSRVTMAMTCVHLGMDTFLPRFSHPPGLKVSWVGAQRSGEGVELERDTQHVRGLAGFESVCRTALDWFL